MVERNKVVRLVGTLNTPGQVYTKDVYHLFTWFECPPVNQVTHFLSSVYVYFKGCIMFTNTHGSACKCLLRIWFHLCWCCPQVNKRVGWKMRAWRKNMPGLLIKGMLCKKFPPWCKLRKMVIRSGMVSVWRGNIPAHIPNSYDIIARDSMR